MGICASTKLYRARKKIIAVLDSGFIGVNSVSPFQNLITNNQILGGYNFPDANSNYFLDIIMVPWYCHHGRLLAKTIGRNSPMLNITLFITEDINSENLFEESYWVESG